MGPALRGRVLFVVSIFAVVVAVAVYVMATTEQREQVGLSVAPGAFGARAALDPAIDRAVFSPNGQRVAAIGRDGVGLARNGRFEPVTEPGTPAVDAAWMPDSSSLLVVEGPATVNRIVVLTLDGAVKGAANLDTPFSVGAGNGLTVDSRGARAVIATETRDTIGGRRRLDLALVDLPTGRVSVLTNTPDANESWPVFVDDTRVVFTRSAATQTVVELDLASKAERVLSRDGEAARAVGVVRDRTVVYAAGDDDAVTVWALTEAGRRSAMARLPAGTIVWAVDPTGSQAVVTGFTTTPEGQRVAELRAVTLDPPDPG